MPAAPGVVQATDAFEIKFVGMNVAPQDCVARNDNELLLYSLTRDTHPAAAASTPPQPSDTDVPGAMRAADRARGVSSLGVDLCGEMLTGSEARGMRRATSSMRASTYKAPAGFAPSPSDVPFIHFDPAIDGHGSGTETDAFVPIPASKSVYMRHVGGGKAEDEGETVNVRFSVMEIDRISDGQLRAIAGIGEVGGYVEGQAGLPYMQLVSGALNMATFLGESALKKYSKPDHVLSKDVEFLLGDGESEAQTGSASETETGAAHVGNYLRYGYYFFLSKPVDACLYAQTGSSSQHVTLLMRRRGYTEKHARKNEKEFFPLTGVSYVVVKVSKGVRRREGEVRSVMEVDHRKRLENLLYMGNALEMLKKNVEKGSWWRPKMLTRSGKKV